MMKNYILVICLFLVLGCKDAQTKSNEIENTETEVVVQKWQTVDAKDDSKPVQRHEAAFVRLGEKFYLLGGRGIRPVSIFDTKTQSWSTGAEPPIELHHFQPVTYGNKILIIAALTGGWPNETPTEHIYIYDPATDAWSKGAEIPEERRRGSTGNIVHERKIYISCGIKNGHIGDHKNWLDRYDPKTGEWEVLANAPRARDHFQAVVANGKIYAAAGRNTGKNADDPFGGTIAEVDAYDIASDSWETLPNSIPTLRAGTAAILYNGAVVVAGGESPVQEKAHAEVEVLDLATHQWKAMPSLLEGRHGTGLLRYKEALYIASGCGNRGGEPELFTMEKFSE